MTINTTEIINSLEDYVLDIKPYHSKLSEIVVEFAFFDDVNVKIEEEHFTQILMNSIWDKDFISNPSVVNGRFQLRAPFSSPTFLNYNNIHSGSGSIIHKINRPNDYLLWYNVKNQNNILTGGLSDIEIAFTFCFPKKWDENTKTFTNDPILPFIITENDGEYFVSLPCSTYNQDIESAFNYKLFNQRYRNEIKLIRKSSPLNPDNLIPQLEGHDFFQTKGAFSFDTLPNQKVKTHAYSSEQLDFKPNLTIAPTNNVLETWSLIKVNPVAYSRPALSLINAPSVKLLEISDTFTSQDFTITCISSGVYQIEGSIDGVADNTANFNTPTDILFSGVKYFKLNVAASIGPQPYTPIVGDMFDISFIDEPIVNYQFVQGYDCGNYDSPNYDERIFYYDDDDLNFVKLQNFRNYILELKAISNTEFTVKFYDREQYLIGNKVLVTSFPNLILGVSYSTSYFILNLVDPFDGFAIDDTITIDLIKSASIRSVNAPFVHIYGTSYTDLDKKKWKFTALSDSEFSSNQISNSNIFVNTAYDSSEVHFTIYSAFIRIEPNDSFWFDVYETKPSYKVIGSVSGEQEMAIVGVPYNNGLISFTLKNPIAKLTIKNNAALPNPREEYKIIDSNSTYELDGKYFKFDRTIRSDAYSDTYKFRYNAVNNSFAVTSLNGTKIGLDFTSEYEWTDRLQNIVLSQNNSFDVKDLDGNLSFTLLKNYSNSPITFTDGYEFYINIQDHGFPLYHSFNGLMFNNVDDNSIFAIEDLIEDKLSLSIDNPLANRLETFESTSNNIALIMNRRQEFADVGTMNVDIFSANAPSIKVGEIRQRDSLQRPVIDFEPSFIDDFMTPMGTPFSLRIEQGSMMNTIAATKITDTIRFTTKTTFPRYRDFEGYDILEYDNELGCIAYELGHIDYPYDPVSPVIEALIISQSLSNPADIYLGYDPQAFGMRVVAIRINHPGYIDMDDITVISALTLLPIPGITVTILGHDYDDFGMVRGTKVKVWLPTNNNDDVTVIIN